jgi:hypothetical protein
MFTTLADVNYFKRDAIAASTSRKGFLEQDILLGVGFSPITAAFEKLLLGAITREAEAAVQRGHRRIRVLLPCNGLSVVYDAVTEGLSSISLGVPNTVGLMSRSSVTAFGNVDIRMHTVPESVIRSFVSGARKDRFVHLLVLGTPGVNDIYKIAGRARDIAILPLGQEDYALISEAIVGSIGGAPAEIRRCRAEITEKIIRPRAKAFPSLVVVEACTDFELGLGVSSLKVFAHTMVAEAYQSTTEGQN